MEHALVTNLDEVGLRYRVRILLTHPDADLRHITETTGLSPTAFFRKGSKRYSPNGKELPGVHQYSAWSYWVEVEDTREFAVDIERMIDLLTPGKFAIENLLAANGQAMLIIEFFGDRNIGDVISPSILTKLINLRLSLGIEVFSRA